MSDPVSSPVQGEAVELVADTEAVETVEPLPGGVMTPDERLDLIEARADAAMPGPWAATRTLLRSGCVGIAVHQRAGGTFVMVDRDREVRVEDAEFMAAAREDVPWLIGQLRDARAEVESQRQGNAGLVVMYDRDMARASDTIDELSAERDAVRAENERLKERERALVRAKDIDLDDARSAVGALRKEVVEANKAYDGAEYMREKIWAELAAERAKVERVAAIRAEWGERKADEPCHELYVALGRALAGGEKE